MSKAFDLERVPPPPPPPEPKLCVACQGFRAECLAPVGEGSVALCWLCAHHVVDHECKLEDAPEAECECLPHQIYPGRPEQAPTSVVVSGLVDPERAGWIGEKRTKEIIDSMTPRQREIYEAISPRHSIVRRGR